jgi:hypothetical protein
MKKGDNVFKIVISVAILISIAVIGFYFYQFAKEPLSVNSGAWGQFGDYLGGTLNPVFGFLSLVVLLLVYIQNKKELEDTKNVLDKQSKTMEIQRFEQTFFSLLRLYDETVAEFKFGTRHGRIALRERMGFSDFLENNEFISKRHTKIIIRIIEFLDHANIDNKLLYSGLLRDSFMNEELVLFCREIMKVPEYDKTFKLLYKYNIFENFDFNNANYPFPQLEKLKQELELAKVVEERLAENEKPIKVSLDEL